MGIRLGGRQKGTKNKATLVKERQQARLAKTAADAGLTPLEYMLQVMRNPKADVARRDHMAISAAPYIHPRLATVQANVTGELRLIDLVMASLPAAANGNAEPKVIEGEVVDALPPPSVEKTA